MEEKAKPKKPLKPFDKKTLKKTLSRTNNKLQAFNKGSKGGNKYNRKTMKSKRSKHFNPKRKVPEWNYEYVFDMICKINGCAVKAFIIET